MRLRQAEDIQRAAFLGMRGKVADCARPAVSCTGVASVQITGDDGAGPAAYTSKHRDVLLAVGSAIGDRLPDDAGGRL